MQEDEPEDDFITYMILAYEGAKIRCISWHHLSYVFVDQVTGTILKAYRRRDTGEVGVEPYRPQFTDIVEPWELYTTSIARRESE